MDAVAALFAVLAVALLGHAQAVDFGLGACKDKEVVQNFDVERYMGLWYEQARYWQLFELNGKCVIAEYAYNATTKRVGVKNSMVDATTLQNKSIEGYAESTDPAASPPVGKLLVTFQIPVVGDQRGPYWVLDTDYVNYSVVYSCSSVLFGALHVESAWILTRSPHTKDPAILDAILAAVTKGGLKRSSFHETVHDCPQTPAP